MLGGGPGSLALVVLEQEKLKKSAEMLEDRLNRPCAASILRVPTSPCYARYLSHRIRATAAFFA